MIGPVYGKNRKMPNGIIQFINKANEGQINEEDESKFIEMSDLIGLCIDNTNSITETIGVTLKVNQRMSNIRKIMELEQKTNE